MHIAIPNPHVKCRQIIQKSKLCTITSAVLPEKSQIRGKYDPDSRMEKKEIPNSPIPIVVGERPQYLPPNSPKFRPENVFPGRMPLKKIKTRKKLRTTKSTQKLNNSQQVWYDPFMPVWYGYNLSIRCLWCGKPNNEPSLISPEMACIHLKIRGFWHWVYHIACRDPIKTMEIPLNTHKNPLFLMLQSPTWSHILEAASPTDWISALDQ